MTHTLLFETRDHPARTAQKATSAIDQLGALLKSDSGHYVAGSIPYGGATVEVRVTWLPTAAGTQVTIQSTSSDPGGAGAERVAARLRDTYLKVGDSDLTTHSRRSFDVSTISIVLSAVIVVGVLLFTLLHK